jgi:long-chain acyl-CoA synthetase
VIGDAQPFIAALVTVDEETLPGWAAAHGKEDLSTEELHRDEDLVAEIQKAVDVANKAVSHAEAVKTFRILPADLSIDGGELTPTLKVKRSVVASNNAALIEEIYG